MNTKQAILNILAIYCLFEEIKQGGDCVDLREKSLSSSRKLSILISPLVQLSGQAAVEETNISVSSCQLLYIYTRGNVALIKLSSHLSLKIIRNSNKYKLQMYCVLTCLAAFVQFRYVFKKKIYHKNFWIKHPSLESNLFMK